MLYLASDSEVEDVTPWDLQIQQSSQKFLQAEEVFLSPTSGVPSVSSLVDMLSKFMRESGCNYFCKGVRRSNYDDLVAQLLATWKPTKSALFKAWPKSYCAKKLALLIHLYVEEEDKLAACKANDP